MYTEDTGIFKKKINKLLELKSETERATDWRKENVRGSMQEQLL